MLTAGPFSIRAPDQVTRPTVAPAGDLLHRQCTITLQLLTDKYTHQWHTSQNINWRDNLSLARNVLRSFMTNLLILLVGHGILYIVFEDIVFEAEQAHNSFLLQRGISSLLRSCLTLKA